MKKLAVIGASSGQIPIVRKAIEMGIEVHCFAWEQGAVCKPLCDCFYPISIFNTNEITVKCRELGIDGVATNASEETALAAAVISENLKLNGTPSDVIKKIQDKREVRRITACIDDLSTPLTFDTHNIADVKFPCVVKPIKGSAKRGVSFCNSANELTEAIEYAQQYNDELVIEEYINGNEYSVESISFHGTHQVVQITQKVTSGFPHFVELEHHQPALIPDSLKDRVSKIVDKILTVVGYTDGATHIEIKIDNDKIYLIEINPRGGGDHISDTLVGLSTDFDYIRSIIEVSLGNYEFHPVNQKAHSGILFLNKQNSRIQKYFDCPMAPWMIERHCDSETLRESVSNYDRNGYLIYSSSNPIHL